MVANQTENSRLKQRSVIEYLVVEKFKPNEIYKKMCDVYGEVWLNKKKKKKKCLQMD